MKSITPALLTFLQTTNAYNKADLYQVKLKNGQYLYATSADIDITWGGNKYYASSQFGSWSRDTITQEAKYSPDSNKVDVTVLAEQEIVLPGTSTSLMATLNQGLFDGALVTIYTVYWPLGTLPGQPGFTVTVTYTLTVTQSGSTMNYSLQSNSPANPLTSTFSIPVHPTVSDVDPGGGFQITSGNVTNLKINGVSSSDFLAFYNSTGGDGGFGAFQSGTVSDYSLTGPQLYSGAEASPTMLAGTFILQQDVPTSGIVGAITSFVGQIANIADTSRTRIKFEVSDLLYILNRPSPPNMIQSACRHQLFDGGPGDFGISNNTFEQSEAIPPPGWISINGGVLGYVGSGAQQAGTQSLSVQATGGSNGGAITVMQFDVTPGTEYCVGGFAKSDGTGVPKILLSFYNSSGVLISSLGATFSTSTAWNFQLAAVTAPAGAATCSIGCYNAASTGTTKAYFDTIQGGPLFPLGLNCGLSAIPYIINTTAAAGSTQLILNTTTALSSTTYNGLAYYSLGRGRFTSGQNAGLIFTIKSQLSTTKIQLMQALPFPVATGDGFQVLPGCDKTVVACTQKFNNFIHFGGMPFVPNPEIAQ